MIVFYSMIPIVVGLITQICFAEAGLTSKITVQSIPQKKLQIFHIRQNQTKNSRGINDKENMHLSHNEMRVVFPQCNTIQKKTGSLKSDSSSSFMDMLSGQYLFSFVSNIIIKSMDMLTHFQPVRNSVDHYFRRHCTINSILVISMPLIPFGFARFFAWFRFAIIFLTQ